MTKDAERLRFFLSHSIFLPFFYELMACTCGPPSLIFQINDSTDLARVQSARRRFVLVEQPTDQCLFKFFFIVVTKQHHFDELWIIDSINDHLVIDR